MYMSKEKADSTTAEWYGDGRRHLYAINVYLLNAKHVIFGLSSQRGIEI